MTAFGKIGFRYLSVVFKKPGILTPSKNKSNNKQKLRIDFRYVHSIKMLEDFL